MISLQELEAQPRSDVMEQSLNEARWASFPSSGQSSSQQHNNGFFNKVKASEFT